MKVLVFYPENDTEIEPDVYDISTPEKRAKAFLNIYRFFRKVCGYFDTFEEVRQQIDGFKADISRLSKIKAKIQNENDKLLLAGIIKNTQDIIYKLEEQGSVDKNFDDGEDDTDTSEYSKYRRKLFEEADKGNGVSAEKLLRQVAGWSGIIDNINNYGGYIWTIVNVKGVPK